MTDWNARIIEDFRASGGRPGGPVAGAPVVLVHHRGRKTGQERLTPMMYLPHETDDDTIYVFASKGGTPENPDWYYNLVAAGQAVVERGSETYPVKVRELSGTERDQRFGEQARRFPSFADYARVTAGIRTIPVLELTRDATR
ncbi:nitroreductase family deazaflavin-dependent oxidoreductase [Actinosynnema sp. NPDC050801]|uniref:nitroreductase family deazaflavin-dependent oxidoreductase n=1 Tax=unclassified Actinosynnema TaxID=2637065 RepID=UPI0033C77962